MRWIALLAFGLFGLPMLIGGVVWGGHRLALVQHGVSTRGKIIEFATSTSTDTDKHGSSRSSTSYYPVVEFTTADGAIVHFRGSTGSGGSPGETLGEPVDVLYPADHPEQAAIASFEQFWLGPLGVGLFGLLLTLGGVGSFFMIGRVDRTLERAMVPGVGLRGALGVPGWRVRQAKITKVDAASEGGDRFVLGFEWFDDISGEVRSAQAKPMHFKRNGQNLRLDDVRQWIGRTTSVSVNPADASDVEPDFLELMKES